MQIGISKTDGLITTIVLGTNNILDGACSVSYRKQTNTTRQIVLSATRPVLDDEFATIEFVTECDKEIIIHRYTIDTIALRWEVTTKYETKSNQEGYIAFSLPIVKSLEKIYHYGHCGPFESKEIDEITLTYRQDMYIPMITGYSLSQNYGLSIVAPFELPKPKLQFVINKQDYIVSFQYLRSSLNNCINAAIYIVPHEGDWRPGLGFVLEKYPEYFYPANASKIRDGWYYLSYPDVHEEQISAFYDRKVEWIEMTAFFPFYGLYIPHLPDWGIIYDSDDTKIAQWEAGAGTKRTSLQKMKDFIQLWHKYGIQVYLYYQSAEAWHQYAKKYFSKDIAIDRKGTPLSAYLFTNLMNPDPSGDWGRYIIDQAKKILKTFPEIDGIFYDRIDYKDYDFGHDDGITMIDNRATYMLAFGQEKINKIIFDLFHEKGKAIWGNVPTSIEVCKGLDGIMAEKNPRYLSRLQYLAIARPLIYLPYDGLPDETEEKLKKALLCGATVSVTYGGKEAQDIEYKYRPIFHLLKKRTWVLNAFCLRVPERLEGNIYRTPDSDYVAIIINPEKFQVNNHPFDYNIPITVSLQDAGRIKHAYLLSGDWQGTNEIEIQKAGKELKFTLPYHLASSAIYLTKNKRYELIRLSPPILIKGSPNEIIFNINNDKHQHDIELRTPWKTIHTTTTTDTVKFRIIVPASATTTENDITVSVDGREYIFTNWVVDPISLVPLEDIYIHHKEGEEIPFYLTNNLHRSIKINLKGTFVAGTGSINIPNTLTTLTLAPFATKRIMINIACKSSGSAELTIQSNDGEIVLPIKVDAGLMLDNDDIFHDDFATGIKKWTVLEGSWNTTMKTAQGSGSAHFACVYNNDWQNYIFESTVRCRGSSKPTIDWLKAYIFFRVQDDKNYYRFGIQGDVGVLSLYKRVNGKWRTIHMVPFIPKKEKWYTLKVQVKGKRIVCFIDNKRVMAFDDETFLYGGIGIGVLEDAQECDYKNIIVKKF